MRVFIPTLHLTTHAKNNGVRRRAVAVAVSRLGSERVPDVRSEIMAKAEAERDPDEGHDGGGGQRRRRDLSAAPGYYGRARVALQAARVYFPFLGLAGGNMRWPAAAIGCAGVVRGKRMWPMCL